MRLPISHGQHVTDDQIDDITLAIDAFRAIPGPDVPICDYSLDAGQQGRVLSGDAPWRMRKMGTYIAGWRWITDGCSVSRIQHPISRREPHCYSNCDTVSGAHVHTSGGPLLAWRGKKAVGQCAVSAWRAGLWEWHPVGALAAPRCPAWRLHAPRMNGLASPAHCPNGVFGAFFGVSRLGRR